MKIKNKELIKQVAEQSGYHQYEVIDILKALAICIANNTNMGYSTAVEGIGTFSPKNGYNIKGVSNITGKEYNTMTSNTLSFKIDSLMRNTLNRMEEQHEQSRK